MAHVLALNQHDLSLPLIVYSSVGENVAVKGRATQSSLYSNSFPFTAIDGNRDGVYAHGSCSHTYNNLSPWWRLDLLKRHKVFSIIIANRKDAVSERLNGAEIRIGDSLENNGNNNTRAGVISTIPAGKSETYTFDSGISGRYVNVFIPGKNRLLTLCEVEVYGYPTPNAKNLALNGKATQSTLIENPWAPFGHAYNAIDGNTDPDFTHGSCTATTFQKNPWWRVDLQDEYTVTSITITNRGDSCPERLNGAEIHIGNSLVNNGNDNPW
ncbi:hypothetical protein AMEX_G2716 [Astyanax mexicanus]|uniref:Fucolectin tachylectin-4 pentraxin-1 domain-containing protein n=1 Tax=Astyanax mexicanus TaxID=7994 RepID=A0A8T2MQ12_ASTMX|nr:hypothetical protein AMEX_G2716 [Astyanax mexicanus]